MQGRKNESSEERERILNESRIVPYIVMIGTASKTLQQFKADKKFIIKHLFQSGNKISYFEDWDPSAQESHLYRELEITVQNIFLLKQKKFIDTEQISFYEIVSIK